MATPVTDLRFRLRNAGVSEEQADAISAAFEALNDSAGVPPSTLQPWKTSPSGRGFLGSSYILNQSAHSKRTSRVPSTSGKARNPTGLRVAGAPQWFRSASMSSPLSIFERPSIPISLARSRRSFFDQSS